jgi:hypothetical protein
LPFAPLGHLMQELAGAPLGQHAHFNRVVDELAVLGLARIGLEKRRKLLPTARLRLADAKLGQGERNAVAVCYRISPGAADAGFCAAFRLFRRRKELAGASFGPELPASHNAAAASIRSTRLTPASCFRRTPRSCEPACSARVDGSLSARRVVPRFVPGSRAPLATGAALSSSPIR